jgi:diguanylate cyclase (GGDEF)-like protein/PAS domain S-box-containing protein
MATIPLDARVDAGLVQRLLLAAQACALLVAAVAVLVLVGWQTDSAALKAIRTGTLPMASGGAVALLLSGISLWLLNPRHDGSAWSRVARLLPWLVVALGGLTLAEYLLHANFGIDELFFPDPGLTVQTGHRGRMSMATSVALLLLGSALLLVRLRSRPAQRIARLVTLATAVMLLVGLLGFFYGQASLYALPMYYGIAVHTLAVLLLLAIGILAIQPARGFASLLVSAGAGGKLARRLLPYAFAVPLVLGWLRLQGERAGFYTGDLGADLVMVTMIVLFVALIWWNAHAVDIADTRARLAQARLRDYADELSDLYERAPCGYHSLDADGVFVRINDTELSWLGYAREEVVGVLHLRELLTPESQAVFDALFPVYKARGWLRDVELEMRRKDGSILPVSASSTVVHDAEGGYVRSRTTVFDITERKRAEQALREADEQARLRLAEIEQIYRYAPVGLFTFDREYRFLRINEHMARINGLSPEAHIGKSMWEVVPDVAPGLVEVFRPIFEQGQPVLDVEIHGRTAGDPDRDHDWLGNYFPLTGGDGQVVAMIGVVLDITERKRTEQALRESEAAVRALSMTDPLTGLANRRRLDESLHTEVQRAQRYGHPLSAVIADLDHFKRINDAHGHPVGDRLLCVFGDILRAHCREVDLVARFGGEEFVILMPEVGLAEAQACAERMRSALADQVIAPLTQPVTASFGVAELAADEAEAALLRRADAALYEAKATGRNRVVLAQDAARAT